MRAEALAAPAPDYGRCHGGARCSRIRHCRHALRRRRGRLLWLGSEGT